MSQYPKGFNPSGYYTLQSQNRRKLLQQQKQKRRRKFNGTLNSKDKFPYKVWVIGVIICIIIFIIGIVASHYVNTK